MRGQYSSICLIIGRESTIVKYMVHDSAVLDRASRALSDPSRRHMAVPLSLGPSVSELAGPLAMSSAVVVQHVQVEEESTP
jgi:hypothetical protein